MARASISGIPIVADGPLSWSLTEGVRPHVGEFSVRQRDIATFMRDPLRPLTLKIQNGDKEEEYKNLFFLHPMPGPTPHVGRIVVADRRWLWSRGHILRRYNVRRRTGVKRLGNPSEVLETMSLAPDVHYAPYSLLDGVTVWTPLLALRDIERAIVAHEASSGFALGDFEIDGAVSSRLGLFPIENLEIDDSLDVGLSKLLGHLPEAQVTVGADGKVYIYSRADNSERSTIEESGPEVVGGGHTEFVSHRRTRPREIRVMFSRQVETRLNAIELEIGSTTDRDPESLFMENVLPVPDYELPLVNGDVVTQGNWITFDEALRAWNLQGVPGLNQLDIATLRKAGVPYIDFWAGMLLSGTLDPDNDWGARVAAMQTHFRRTYRINRRVMDRLLQIHDYRVGVQDPSGTGRGTAQAYSDYAIVPGQRFLLSQAGNTPDLSWAVNIAGYPRTQRGSEFTDEIGESTKPAPAVVRVIDSDQGILQVDWTPDHTRSYEMALPSMIEIAGSGTGQNGKPAIPGPSGDLSNRQRPLSFNSVAESRAVPQFVADHKLAVILTATPGSPNTEAQFEVITVRPNDVRDVLPPELLESVLASDGPPMDARIGAGVEQARVAWIDSRSNDIERALGIVATQPGETVDLSDITINYSSHGFSNQYASLQSIARAEAARIWASMVDRYYGDKTVTMNADLRPIGRIGSVTHTKGTDGSLLSKMDLPAQQPTESLFSFLPLSVQRIVRRLANMGRS